MDQGAEMVTNELEEIDQSLQQIVKELQDIATGVAHVATAIDTHNEILESIYLLLKRKI